MDVQSWIDFSDLGEEEKFTWHKFHFEEWGERYFEGNTPLAMHNATRRAVTLTWNLIDSQLTVDLIADTKNAGKHQEGAGQRRHKGAM